MSGWLPIDTAPQDGSRILLSVENMYDGSGYMCVGYWCDGWVKFKEHPDVNKEFDMVVGWLPFPNLEEGM